MIEKLKNTELMATVWGAVASALMIGFLVSYVYFPHFAGFFIISALLSTVAMTINLILWKVSKVQTSVDIDDLKKK